MPVSLTTHPRLRASLEHILSGDCCSIFSPCHSLALPSRPLTAHTTPLTVASSIPFLACQLRLCDILSTSLRPRPTQPYLNLPNFFAQCSPRADMAFDPPPTSTTNTQATAESCQLRSTRTSSTRQPCQATVNSLRNIYPTHLNTRLCASRGSPSRSDASRCAYRSENNSPSSSSPPPSSALLSSQ